MKFIKTINEYLNPDKNTYVNYIFKELEKKLNLLGIPDTDIIKNNICSNLEIDINTQNKIISLVKKFNIKTIKNNILLTCDLYNGLGLNIVAKNIYTFRVKPNRYVYHSTKKENIESILKNGLYPKDSSNWEQEDPHLEYPPAIFVSNIKHLAFHSGDNYIILKINTSLLKNKWFHDLNMFFGDKAIRYIMTFEAIPPEAITLAQN